MFIRKWVYILIWIFSLVILILLTDSGARWIFVQILVTSNKKKKKNVSCDFCIYFFISLLFYVQRWTDFEASSTWEETFAAWRVSSLTDFLIIRLNVPSDFRCIIHSDIMFIHLISVCYFALSTKASETVRALRVSHVCPS